MRNIYKYRLYTTVHQFEAMTDITNKFTLSQHGAPSIIFKRVLQVDITKQQE